MRSSSSSRLSFNGSGSAVADQGSRRRKSSLGAALNSVKTAVGLAKRSSVSSTFSSGSQELGDDLSVGQKFETLNPITMREEEDFDSQELAELPGGCVVTIVELGLHDSRRVKVECVLASGWISARAANGLQLISKRRPEIAQILESYEVGEDYETKSPVTIRDDEHLDSMVVETLRTGSFVRILELSRLNERRAKVAKLRGEGSEREIDTDRQDGWISLVTKSGEVLVEKVGRTAPKPRTSKSAPLPSAASAAKTKSLLEAARSGDIDTIRKLTESNQTVMGFNISSRISVNVTDIRGKTPLIYAAAYGQVEVVRYLLSLPDCDINAHDDTHRNALVHACKMSTYAESASQAGEIAMHLIDAGIEAEARDINGCTALMFAVANGSEVISKLLVESGANLNVRDYEGHSCLDYAKNFDHDELCRFLIRKGALEGEDSDEELPMQHGHSLERLLEVIPSGSASLDAPEFKIGLLEDVDEQVSIAATVDSASTTSEPKAMKRRSVVKRKSVRTKRSSISASTTDTLQLAADEGEIEDDDTLALAEAQSIRSSPKRVAKKKAKAKAKVTSRTAKVVAKREDMKMAAEMAASALAAADSEIKVEEFVPEIDEKERSLAKLRAFMDLNVSPDELDLVIEAAISVGVATDSEEITNARQKSETLKRRIHALQKLKVAIADRSVEKLSRAIAEAETNGVQANDIDPARAVLREEIPKQAAREKLQEAKAKGDSKILRAAIEGAKALLEDTELVPFEELLRGAESKEKAEAALKVAIEVRDVAQLRFSIQQAVEALVNPSEIAKAEEVLKVEEPKFLAREAIAMALDPPSISSLRKAIEMGKQAGLAVAELNEAKAVLYQEEKKQRLLQEVKLVLTKVAEVDMTSMEALQKAKSELSSAIAAAKDSWVPEQELVEAELRRRRLHNAVEDLKGSIRVFCRIRPISRKEIDEGDQQIVDCLDIMTLRVKDEVGSHQTFQYDAVFAPGTQEEVFEDCRDLVQSALDGYNVTLFAYGQTGAGKTYTMAGTTENPGVATRTISELFDCIERSSDRFTFTVVASMLELYQNNLVDLLSKSSSSSAENALKKKMLSIKTDKSGCVAVENLVEEECFSASDLSALVDRGNEQRSVAATAMNSESSRSHLVLTMRIVSINKQTKSQLRGKILICDLAGSERLKKSQATAEKQKEAIEINKSLTALGDVIEALTKGEKSVPFRNHKLTQLMQDSLGGTAKTLMFVNCSPAGFNRDETVNALKYAERAKKITNSHIRNSVRGSE